MHAYRMRLRSTVRSVPFAVAAALVMTGCSNTPFAKIGQLQRAQTDARIAATSGQDDSVAPPTQLVRPDERDYVASAAYWGAQVQANPNDVDASLNFARNLRMMGGGDQAVSILRDLVMRQPNNGRVIAEYGKALTAAERAQEALGFLTQAIQLSPNDWTLLSARGVAYDQSGDHISARADYTQALRLDEDNPTVLTNLALSYVLAGQPAQAEPIMRRVVARADATPAMRQNLAMVLALLGNTQEASAYGRMDLAPSDATSNVELFGQFQAPRTAPTPMAAERPQAPIVEAAKAMDTAAPAKAQASLASDFGQPSSTPAAAPVAPIAGDPMAMPVAAQMSPVADDPTAPVKHKTARKPTAPKIAPATIAATAANQPATTAPRKIISNGDTLITTINGIPVFGENKPKTKPEANLISPNLRGGAL